MQDCELVLRQMPPINLLNYHLVGDRRPHSRETANRPDRVVKAANFKPADIIRKRNV